jgi:hypothetical protein
MFKNCFPKNVSIKSLIIAIVVMFGYIFLTDFLIHGVLLKDAYMATASLWRPEAEMHQNFCWMLLGQFLIAKFFVVVFIFGREKGSWCEGARYGAYMWAFTLGGQFINYAVTPQPRSLLLAWAGTSLVQLVLGGIILSKVYCVKKKA